MTSIAQDSVHGMRRAIDWKHAFFVAAGVPALVLFSMGGISATVGAPAWLVWTLSVLSGSSTPSSMPRSPACTPGSRAARPCTAPPPGSATASSGTALAVVQLAGLDPGAGHRLRSRRRLSPLDLLRARRGDQHVAGHAREPGLPEGWPDAAHQRHVHHRRGHHAGRVEHPAPRHPAHRAHPDAPHRGRADAAADRELSRSSPATS